MPTKRLDSRSLRSPAPSSACVMERGFGRRAQHPASPSASLGSSLACDRAAEGLRQRSPEQGSRKGLARAGAGATSSTISKRPVLFIWLPQRRKGLKIKTDSTMRTTTTTKLQTKNTPTKQPQRNNSYYNENSTTACDQAPRERRPRRVVGCAVYVPPTSRQAAEYSLTAHSHLLAWRSPEGEMGGGEGGGRGRGGSIFTVSTAGLNGE